MAPNVDLAIELSRLGGETLAFMLHVQVLHRPSFASSFSSAAARLCLSRSARSISSLIVAIGIEETCAHDGRFEIVMPDDPRHASEIAEGALVQPEKRLELLIPDRFLAESRYIWPSSTSGSTASPRSGLDLAKRRDQPFSSEVRAT
jgi:hypothetical protein